MAKQLALFTDTFILTETGLQVNGKPDFEEWMDYGVSLKTLDGTARQFAIGDWIVHGFEAYERGKWEAIEEIWGPDGRSTLQQYQRVSSAMINLVIDYKIYHGPTTMRWPILPPTNNIIGWSRPLPTSGPSPRCARR